MNQIAQVGHNSATPFDLYSETVNDLYDEAKAYCDGDPIKSQGEADLISQLLDVLRKVAKDVENARKEEKRPHDEAAKAVQEKYKPILTKADMAADACKKALSPWLQKIEDEKRAEAEKARREAEEKARLAREAHQKAQTLADMEAAEAALKDAKAADRAATSAEKSKAHANGGERAVGLVTRYRAEIADYRTFAAYVWRDHPAELNAFLDGLAQRLVSSRKTDLPGVTCHQERVAR